MCSVHFSTLRAIIKIHKLIHAGMPERDAIEQVDTIDIDRAEFVKKYLKLNWPDHHLYTRCLIRKWVMIMSRKYSFTAPRRFLASH